MGRIDVRFVATGVAFGLFGMAFGIWMGITQEIQYAHLHAHINLVGWVAMILFGLTYRAYPAMGRSGLARLHYWVALIGAVTFLPGIYLATFEGVIIFAVVGSLLTLASMALFFTNILVHAKAPD
jgi:cbb3-type cytochrome oxidase subunit 1